MQKKVMALCLRVQFFLANPILPVSGNNDIFHFGQHKIEKTGDRIKIFSVSYLPFRVFYGSCFSVSCLFDLVYRTVPSPEHFKQGGTQKKWRGTDSYLNFTLAACELMTKKGVFAR